MSTTLAQCQGFFDAIFDPGDVIEFRPIKPTSQRWATPGELPAIVEWLLKLNTQGAQCYFGANPRKQAGESTEEGVALARCLYADFDGGLAVEEAWSRIKAAGLPVPTATVFTGGGVHCWWRLDQPTADRKLHGRLLKALAVALPSDEAGTSGWPRIMRLPGFVNTKYEHKPEAELVDVDAGRVYSLDELTPTKKGMSNSTRAFLDRGERGSGEGRRESMFRAACDLRDHGWTAAEAEAAIMPRMRQFGLSDDDLADCPRQIHNAWSRPPRAISTPAAPKKATSSSSIEPWRPFPTAALPEVAAKLVSEGGRAIGCDEAFVALPLLAVLGSAIGTTRRAELKPGWRVLPIVWPVVVAESGSQKSPGADVSLDHVRGREERLQEERAAELAAYDLDVEEYEKARGAWRHAKQAGAAPVKPRRPADRHVLLDDLTVEALVAALAENPRGLLVANDELSGWLGAMGRYNGTPSADEAFYLKAYNGRSHSVGRKSGSLFVRQAAVWVTGCVPPGVLARAIGVERRESGLLGRLLLASPPRRPKVWTTGTVDWSARGTFSGVLDRLYELDHKLVDGRAESAIVRLSGKAERLYSEFYEAHGQETIELSGDLAAAWSKLEEIPGRLALIFHETRLAAGEKIARDEIDAGSMAAALELVDWFKRETGRVYSLLAETDADRADRQADDRLAAFVAKHGGTVATRDVIAGVRSITSADEAEAGLQRLVDAGRGRWIDRPTTEKGGRPTRLFELVEPSVEPIRRPASAQPPQEAEKTGCACADAPPEPEPEAVAAGEEYVEI